MEENEGPLTREIRNLDMLAGAPARGRAMDQILREQRLLARRPQEREIPRCCVCHQTTQDRGIFMNL